MLTGWTQFSQRLSSKYMAAHRLVGKIYVLAVLISGSAGLFVAFFASGGIISVIGFGILALLWLTTVIKAYTTILKRKIIQHEYWMIRNYALTFAAVTLRNWLPLLISFVFRGDFFPSYRIVSWLCWVPNIAIAEIIVSKRKKAKIFTIAT